MATQRKRLKALRNVNHAPIVGVVVTITKHENTHVGLLYRDNDDRVLLLHLRFHLDLANETFDRSYLDAEPAFEPEDQEALAGYCRLIAREELPIRFALHYNPKRDSLMRMRARG